MEFRPEYDFLAPGRIVFGWGRRRELGALAKTLGTRAFLVHGSRTLERLGVLGELADELRAEGIDVVDVGGVTREPLVEDVDRVAREIRAGAVRTGAVRAGDFVVGIGGGAALDLAKAVSALATNHESDTVRDYLEGVGTGLGLERDPLPLVALPTTAGTGSEATKNAVVSHPGDGEDGAPFKKSLRSLRMVPRIALVDPELTVSLPPVTTAHTGMDALTQLIESYVSARAQPLPQALALEGLRRGAPALAVAVERGDDRGAREAMAHAALLSGLALANSGLGMAHGVAAALGVQCGVPHGLACALMLPAALRINREVKRREIATIGEIVCERSFESDDDAVEAAIAWVDELGARVGIPRRLSELGVKATDLPGLVRGARGNSMSGNPRTLSDAALRELLESLL